VCLSGSGAVEECAAERVMGMVCRFTSLSVSPGILHFPLGLTEEQSAFLTDLKNARRARLEEMGAHFGVTYLADQRPWSLPCDVALPCATQNELDGEDARTLLKNGCICVAEGANMPSTLE